MDTDNLPLYGQSVEFYYKSKPDFEGIHLHHKDVIHLIGLIFMMQIDSFIRNGNEL